MQIKQERGAPDSAAAKAFVLEGTRPMSPHNHRLMQPKPSSVDGCAARCRLVCGLRVRRLCAAAMARAQAEESPRTLRAAQALAGQSPGNPQHPRAAGLRKIVRKRSKVPA